MHKDETPTKKDYAAPGKRQRSPTEDVDGKRRKAKLPYNTGKNVCRVTAESTERAKTFGRRIAGLRALLSMKNCGERELEDPTNFPNAKMALTVVRVGTGSRQAWGRIEEAKRSDTPIITDNEQISQLKQFCSGRVPVLVHPSLYRALKLTFPWDVGGISQDGSIKTEMGTGSMGEAVGIPTQTMFQGEAQP